MFSAYDRESGNHLHTGRNSDTEEQCVDEVIEFLTQDTAEDEDVKLLLSFPMAKKKTYLSALGFEIEEHNFDIYYEY